jgi:hypothetical protein
LSGRPAKDSEAQGCDPIAEEASRRKVASPLSFSTPSAIPGGGEGLIPSRAASELPIGSTSTVVTLCGSQVCAVPNLSFSGSLGHRQRAEQPIPVGQTGAHVPIEMHGIAGMMHLMMRRTHEQAAGDRRIVSRGLGILSSFSSALIARRLLSAAIFLDFLS